MKDNIRNIIGVIEYLETRNDKQAALMFIDAEKAFDNISWNFMKKNLEMMDVGQSFLTGLGAIYSKQKAMLIVNNVITEKM